MKKRRLKGHKFGSLEKNNDSTQVFVYQLSKKNQSILYIWAGREFCLLNFPNMSILQNGI